MGIIQIQGHSIHPRFLDKKSVVVDLGANHGEFSAEVKERFQCSCFAVEGNPSLAARLRERTGAIALHALVGDRDRIATFSITKNDQCSTILELPASLIVCQEQVRMLSLESLFKELDLRQVDLLKMDIEGAEIATLDACPDHVLQRVAQLAIEFHDGLGMTSIKEIHAVARRLQKLGFHWLRGTFSNYEDNLFVNRLLCPFGPFDSFYNRGFVRYWNGLKRVTRRKWPAGGARERKLTKDNISLSRK
jgi:FkbM family methyltransferase